jgi:hypothetical protein
VTSLDASPGLANARLTGSFDYVSRETGKPGSVPVTYAATLRYEGHSWRLVSVR